MHVELHVASRHSLATVTGLMSWTRARSQLSTCSGPSPDAVHVDRQPLQLTHGRWSADSRLRLSPQWWLVVLSGQL